MSELQREQQIHSAHVGQNHIFNALQSLPLMDADAVKIMGVAWRELEAVKCAN
jgi:hypothetical protein